MDDRRGPVPDQGDEVGVAVDGAGRTNHRRAVIEPERVGGAFAGRDARTHRTVEPLVGAVRPIVGQHDDKDGERLGLGQVARDEKVVGAVEIEDILAVLGTCSRDGPRTRRGLGETVRTRTFGTHRADCARTRVGDRRGVREVPPFGGGQVSGGPHQTSTMYDAGSSSTSRPVCAFAFPKNEQPDTSTMFAPSAEPSARYMFRYTPAGLWNSQSWT